MRMPFRGSERRLWVGVNSCSNENALSQPKWTFMLAVARQKLRKLYPSIEY